MSVLDYAVNGVENCRMSNTVMQPQPVASQNKNIPSEYDKSVVLDYLNDIYRDLENVEHVIPYEYGEDERINILRSSIRNIDTLRDMVATDRVGYVLFKHVWSLANAHFLKELYLIAPSTKG